MGIVEHHRRQPVELHELLLYVTLEKKKKKRSVPVVEVITFSVEHEWKDSREELGACTRSSRVLYVFTYLTEGYLFFLHVVSDSNEIKVGRNVDHCLGVRRAS